MQGQCSRAACNQEQVMIASVWQAKQTFNCVLLYWRYLSARPEYNDFGCLVESENSSEQNQNKKSSRSGKKAKNLNRNPIGYLRAKLASPIKTYVKSSHLYFVKGVIFWSKYQEHSIHFRSVSIWCILFSLLKWFQSPV